MKLVFLKKLCLVKAVKKCFFFFLKLSVWLTLIKVMVWVVNYQKWQNVYIYEGVYFMLSINFFFLIIIIIIITPWMTLNKRFCKKVFSFNISFFKKCYVHNIFTLNFHNIMIWSYSNIFYSFNIFIGTSPHLTQPNPFPFSFSFSFFLPFFFSHKSQPFTFCLLSFSLSTFLHTFSHIAHTHALLHLDLTGNFS